jgi:hypothetical protein
MERRHTAYLALASLAATATAFAGGYSAGLAAADTGSSGPAATAPYPDWFLAIWDAYDRNPAITPAFDFASLYAAQPIAG